MGSCLKFVYVVPLLLLSLACFVGTLVLAIIGIGKATEDNLCILTNGSCTALTDIEVALEGPTVMEQKGLDPDINPQEFAYWMAGATGCGLIFAIIITLSLWALEDALRPIVKKKITEDYELEATDGKIKSPTPPPAPEPIDIIGNHVVIPKKHSVLRPFDGGALVALFFSCLFAILALLCFLWAIAVGVNHSRQQDRTVVPFIIVEFLAAVALPFFAYTSGILMANVIDFITFGEADARTALPRFLSNVKFERGEKNDHWVVEKTFYFTLKKREEEERRKHGFLFSCYPNFATWILVGIVGLSLNLAVSYFADITLDMQVSVTSCDDPRIDRTFSCFNMSTLIFVDCVNDIGVELIHCFKFYRFGVDVDLISSLATTYAFYLLATGAFGYLFVIMKVFLHLTKNKNHLWGALFVVLGMVMFLVSVIVIIVWLSGYISPSLSELARLNVIHLSQFVMVSLLVFFVGILMVGATWAEKEPKKTN